jgi:hypothetical protein
MNNERNPARVLGWLSTSANYTVVTSSAPPQHRPIQAAPSRVAETVPRPAVVKPPSQH